MNPLNVEKKGWQAIANIRMKSVQMNLLHAEKKGWQNSVNMTRETIKMFATAQVLLMKLESFMLLCPVALCTICSCCDQLWYKHSVTAAKKLRIPNPDIVKYLLSKTSVNDVEWICQSCIRYLKKNKIPPYAAKNGMLFPLKIRDWLFKSLCKLQEEIN